jgi:hypothetical protein
MPRQQRPFVRFLHLGNIVINLIFDTAKRLAIAKLIIAIRGYMYK